MRQTDRQTNTRQIIGPYPLPGRSKYGKEMWQTQTDRTPRLRFMEGNVRTPKYLAINVHNCSKNNIIIDKETISKKFLKYTSIKTSQSRSQNYEFYITR